MIEVRLRELLEATGRSRRWLSQEAGIDYKTLMRIEQAESSNRIELRVLDEICRALQCQPGDLLVRADDTGSRTAQKSTRKGK
jgi:DNA-binding Xre family transcriptional regulator